MCFDLLWFTECMPGYTGMNCSAKCSYPSYGRSCQGICNCIEILCDIFGGCSTLTSGIVWFLVNERVDFVSHKRRRLCTKVQRTYYR